MRSREALFELCGTGVAKYRRLIKVYQAALYRPDCDASGLFESAMRLELAYFRSINGVRFGELAEKSLSRALPPASYAALQARLTKLHQAYRSVKSGDRYALTYRPGEGTQLDLNGDSLERIEGKDFARAYFGIWLGPRPLDRDLRDRLTAQKE